MREEKLIASPPSLYVTTASSPYFRPSHAWRGSLSTAAGTGGGGGGQWAALLVAERRSGVVPRSHPTGRGRHPKQVRYPKVNGDIPNSRETSGISSNLDLHVELDGVFFLAHFHFCCLGHSSCPTSASVRLKLPGRMTLIFQMLGKNGQHIVNP